MKKRVDSSYVSRKAYTNADTWKKGPYCGCLRWFGIACVLSKTRAENCSEATIKKSQNKRNDKNKKKKQLWQPRETIFSRNKKSHVKKKKKKKGLRGINILPKFSSSWAIKNHQRFIHSDRLALMILLMLIIIIFIFFSLYSSDCVGWESDQPLFFFCFFLLFSLCSTVACACFCWFFWQPAGPRPGLLLFKA